MNLTVPDTFIIPFIIHIKMTSDWHVGAGSGRGEIDSEVQRDADGLPYIPAKTLTGILRDSCEQIALALGGNWQKWIDFLFGDQPTLAKGAVELEPRPAVLSIHSAHFPQNFKDALSTKPLEKLLKWAVDNNQAEEEKRQIAQQLQMKRQLNNAIAFIKPSVKIVPETGSAEPKALRFEEVVRMDAVLKSEHCTFNFSGYPNITDYQKKTAFALLIAGIKLVERLGGKRRRGNGSCEINILDIKADEWLKDLEKNYSTIGNPPEWKKPQLEKTGDHQEVDSTWFTVPLTIKTLSPIILPKRTVGNVVERLDYIPGRYFLGHLHRALGDFMDVSHAIGCGDLVMTNATIDIDGLAGRPTPFCLFGEKLDGSLSKGKGVYNRFKEAEPEGVQLKGERSGYVGQFDDSNLPQYKTVKLEVNTHNTIDDKYQRPSPETGGAVYSYQAIPASTTFKAELRLPQSIKEHLDSKLSSWSQKLEETIRIGQSKKDQYGSIKIEVGKPQKLDSSKPVGVDKLLYVWFLSDVLMRDERLNPTTDPKIFREALADELGVTLTEREDDDLLSLMMKSRRTESWQVRWGLPRPSMLGWEAGSCAVYEVQGEIKPEKMADLEAKLAELEAKGIGDRRAEGYGQICFNDPLLTAELRDKTRSEVMQDKPKVDFNPIPYDEKIPNDKQPPVSKYARTIETAAWREAIENKALAIAANSSDRERILGIKIDGKDSQPPMSQLGGLRSNLRRLQSSADQTNVTSWITALESVSNRKEKWDKTDNGLEKIRELVTNSQKVWQVLDIPYSDLTITTGGRNGLQQNLWAEAVRTLVDAIIRAHKRDLEKTQQEAA